MKNEKIVIDENAYRKRYGIRRSGRKVHSWETTIPYLVIEREARKHGISIDDVPKFFEVEWLFDNFDGLHMRLIPREDRKMKDEKNAG